ncbi:MAG: hypothetical protein Q9214_002572 [Letrouitia sp. 1 TL-2023]
MVATPIFINTFVVFVRLYWFERRFQNVVREARNPGRTRSRSRTKTEAKGEPDFNREEQGVRGRSIVVLHKGDQPAVGGTDQSNAAKSGLEKQSETDSSATSSSSHEDKSGLRTDQNAGQDETEPPQSPSMHREITFADEVDEVGELKSTAQRLPRHLSAEEHIAFLENQRNPKDKGTLRIPGPREFDCGHVPETLAEDEDGTPLTREVTSPVDRVNSIGTPVKRNVTIDEPRHPRRRTGTGLSKISIPSQRTNLSDQRTVPVEEFDDKGDLPPAPPKKTGTFSSIRKWNSRDPEPVTPYLSWQPTIGRNSAFVDLTEEQREELGGIEYRSLKTLAIVLVCKSTRK